MFAIIIENLKTINIVYFLKNQVFLLFTVSGYEF